MFVAWFALNIFAVLNKIIDVLIKMLPNFTSRSFGNCPSTITSEESHIISDINVNKVIETKDAETQTIEYVEKEKRQKRSRYIEMSLDESDDNSVN